MMGAAPRIPVEMRPIFSSTTTTCIHADLCVILWPVSLQAAPASFSPLGPPAPGLKPGLPPPRFSTVIGALLLASSWMWSSTPSSTPPPGRLPMASQAKPATDRCLIAAGAREAGPAGWRNLWQCQWQFKPVQCFALTIWHSCSGRRFSFGGRLPLASPSPGSASLVGGKPSACGLLAPGLRLRGASAKGTPL